MCKNIIYISTRSHLFDGAFWEGICDCSKDHDKMGPISVMTQWTLKEKFELYFPY